VTIFRFLGMLLNTATRFLHSRFTAVSSANPKQDVGIIPTLVGNVINHIFFSWEPLFSLLCLAVRKFMIYSKA
jgi:hypothetical protein